ncbi:MAG: FkbM family methyltransferase [Pseudomonadota bacterium]
MTPWASSYLALDGRLTVVEVAATDDAWAERVRADRPETRLHRFPRGSTGTGGLDQLGGIPSLDRALAAIGVRHLNYLRIADAGAAMPTLLGARRLLSHARIDVVEIGGGPAADRMMPAVTALLEPFDFLPLPPSEKLNDLLLTPYDAASGSPLVFALHRRFLSAIGSGNREPDLGALMATHRLAPRGIIHVGAHKGEEVAAYLALGFQRVLLIEADPSLAAVLSERFRDEPRVSVASCAITDFDGMVELRVASSRASNSILSLKEHADIFPDISEIGRLEVEARTLDGLLADGRHGDDVFNIMALDIQGAELLALRGAAALLPRLDGLLIEVNFAELYQGCAQIEDIDDHLIEHGFARAMTMSPYKSNYGDAFYVSRASAPSEAGAWPTSP